MSIQILALSALLLCASAANAQYDTLWIGTADGPSTSLDNTPFATEVARAARTQYLVRYDALVQAGLLPSTDILGVCLQVVDDDLADPACLVDLHTENKNESSGNLTDFIYSGLTPTGTSNGVNLTASILGLPWNTSQWQWLGAGSNMIIEINFERGEEAGLSPRIMLDMDLDYTATFTARTEQLMMGHDISMTNPDIEYGSDNSLPVLGLLVASPTGTDERANAGRMGLFPNPTTDELNVRLPWSASEVRVLDLSGRSVLRPTFTTTGTVDVSGLPSGCFVLRATGANGTATTRFIKE